MAPAPAAPAPTVSAREQLVAGAVEEWRARLSDLAGGSALWDVDTLGDALVDLTAAHPSGIAQLFAGRSTRLSNLVREGSALTQARRRARVVGARTEELAQRYGVAPTYIAMGVASWREDPPEVSPTGVSGATAGAPVSAAPPGAGGTAPADGSGVHGSAGVHDSAGSTDQGSAGETPGDATPAAGLTQPRIVHAPVLLRPVRMSIHGSDAEIDLELDPAVEINTVLVRELRARGVTIDPVEVARSTMGPHGFSPRPALQTIEQLGRVLPEFHLEARIVLGAFVHPGQALADDLDAQRDDLARHDVIAALAGDPGATAKLKAALPAEQPTDRDPAVELGVGDLDAGQQRVLDAVAAGGHLLVDAPPGVDVPATVAAVLAQAAADGKTAVYVPGTRRAAQSLLDEMRAVGVEDLALDLSNDATWRSTTARRIIDGLNPPEPAVDAAQVERDRRALVAARTKLSNYIRALHTPRPPWDASAYHALQALAQLTSERPGPRTQVRLETKAVRSMDEAQRQFAREELARAAALGAFRLRASDTPWFGAQLTSAEHANVTLERVRRLSAVIPRLREQIAATAAQTGLDEAATLNQWSEQLELLDGIRSSLDVFTPQVFERSAVDMVAATATRTWRAQRGVDLPWGTRRRLRKQAKDLLRPGIAVADLHAELLGVQARRELWRRNCAGGGWPRLPEGMTAITGTERDVSADVAELQPVLSPTMGDRDLRDIPLEDLATRLDRLGADDAALRQMPERAAVLAVLSNLGLKRLIEDLTFRRVPTNLVGPEFDLAWWSSVLEEVLAEDPAMAGLEAASLDAAAEDLRVLDVLQTESLVAPVLASVREHVRAAIAADRPRAQELYRTVLRGQTDLKEILTSFGAVAKAARPVWIVAPMVVPQVLPAGRDIDLVVLDAVQHLPVEQAVSAIARAKQVVVFGDTRRRGTGLVASMGWLPSVALPGDRVDQDTEIAAFLAQHGYADIIRPVPAPPRASTIGLELVAGKGMPAPGTDVVESVQSEVDRVVDLVIDHALTRPEESLAVIALNTRHADRVREAVMSTAAGSHAMSSFFDQSNPEAFTVVDIEAVAGLRRDAVVLTLGYGKTPHGRVLHRFGSVSGPNGAEFLVDALDACRHRLTVVSCLAAADLESDRLRSEGALMLKDVLRLAESGSIPVPEETEETEEERTPDRLLVDLAERLWRLGLTVVPRYGVPGGVRIPLAIGHPQLPGELLLAVLTDDESYVAEPSLRRRDRHWVQRLENRGWRVRTVFSTAVFMDPQGVAEQILADVNAVLEERLAAAGTTSSSVHLPSAVVDLPEDPEPVAPSARSAQGAHGGQRPSVRGEQIAGGPTSRPEARRPGIAGDRGERPAVQPGLPLNGYGDDELDLLVAWIASDGVARTVPEMVAELRGELGITRRGTHVDAVLSGAVRRSGLAAEETRVGSDGSAGVLSTGSQGAGAGSDLQGGPDGSMQGAGPSAPDARPPDARAPDAAATGGVDAAEDQGPDAPAADQSSEPR